jgi:hypothetical protein
MKPRVLPRVANVADSRVAIKSIKGGVRRTAVGEVAYEKRRPMVLPRGGNMIDAMKRVSAIGVSGGVSVRSGTSENRVKTPKYADLFVGKVEERKIEDKADEVPKEEKGLEEFPKMTDTEKRMADYLQVAEEVVNPVVEEVKVEEPVVETVGIAVSELNLEGAEARPVVEEEKMSRRRRRRMKREAMKESAE